MIPILYILENQCTIDYQQQNFWKICSICAPQKNATHVSSGWQSKPWLQLHTSALIQIYTISSDHLLASLPHVFNDAISSISEKILGHFGSLVSFLISLILPRDGRVCFLELLQHWFTLVVQISKLKSCEGSGIVDKPDRLSICQSESK